MLNVPFDHGFGKGGFAKISRTFLDDPSLAFARVLPAEVIEMTFRKYDGLFGGLFYNSVFVLWAFLSQVLSDGKHRSCSTAVGRIAMFCLTLGHEPPDEDTGNYCRARAKLSCDALHELVTLVANNTESLASSAWLWQGKYHAKLVDGFTATIPETMKLRMIRYSLTGKGRRSKSITVVTTLVDPRQHDAASVAELYGHRWNVELDIRQIKQTLNMDHFRCKCPEMVERELWTTLLGYNLVRKTMCEAANFCGVIPRRLSFTRTCAHILEAWMIWSPFGLTPEMLNRTLTCLGSLTVPDRPGRFEPRVIKRRLYHYPLMKKPRHVLKNKMRNILS